MQRCSSEDWEVIHNEGSFLMTGNASFLLMSDKSFLLGVARPQGIAIELYTFGHDGHDAWFDGYVETPTHTATFMFPELLPDCKPVALSMHLTVPSECRDSGNRNFTASPVSSMLFIRNIRIVTPGNGGIQFKLVVDYKRFLSLCDIASRSPNAGGAVVFPWDSWGPKMTRTCETQDYMLARGHVWRSQDWLEETGMHGSRFLFNRQELWDFNQLDIARELGQPPAPSPYWSRLSFRQLNAKRPERSAGRIVTKPTVLAAANVFKQDMVTSLPYRVITVHWPDVDRYDIVNGGDTWLLSQWSNENITPRTIADLYALTL